MTLVKRPYDASSRRARAQHTHDRVVAAARARFLTSGFAATKVQQVAADTGVSVEYVYKRFGSKAGLVRAVVERALEGTAPVPAESRSDALASAKASTLVRGWGRLAAEVAPEVAPLLLLVREAAVQDSKVAALATELDDSRLERMTHNAQRLVGTGELRDGVEVDDACDVLWTFSSPELYDLLVVRRGWDAGRYGDFVARGITGALLTR